MSALKKNDRHIYDPIVFCFVEELVSGGLFRLIWAGVLKWSIGGFSFIYMYKRIRIGYICKVDSSLYDSNRNFILNYSNSYPVIIFVENSGCVMMR